MRLKISPTTLLAGLALSVSAALAEPVRFVTIDYEPYALHDDSLGRLGLFADFHKAIAERAELAYSDIALPIPRVIKNLEHDVSDCGVFLLSPASEESYMLVAKVLDGFDTIIVTRPGLEIAQVEGLHGHRLAIPRGSFEKETVATDPDIERFITNDIEQSVQMLRAGRVDAIAGTAFTILFRLSVEGVGRDEIGQIFTYKRQQVWLHCARDQLPDETIKKLRQATDALKLEGAFETFIKRYISDAFSS